MTPPVVAMRILGTVITHTGAWYRKPGLIALGLMTVILGWMRGIILQNANSLAHSSQNLLPL
ncbi:MAG: hypothetical protein NVS3B14_08200 [Ktedonobacteraceae bacterium]